MHIPGLGPWPLFVMGSLWSFISQPAYGVQIVSSSVSHRYGGVGDRVSLRCHFNLASEDVGPLDIEWTIKPSDPREHDTPVIWYAGHKTYSHHGPFEGRVQFTSPDPAGGNASITITHLKPDDTGAYQCRVRKTPGISSTMIHLQVMERPSKPACDLEGVAEMGQNVVLRCKSAQGPDLRYKWSKLSGNKMLPRNATFDPVQGSLRLTVSTEAVLGTYACTAENLVGVETCTVGLGVTSPVKVNWLVTSAAATAAVLVVIISVTAIVVICRRWRRKMWIQSEMVEDTPCPLKFLSRESNQAVSSSGSVQESTRL